MIKFWSLVGIVIITLLELLLSTDVKSQPSGMGLLIYEYYCCCFLFYVCISFHWNFCILWHSFLVILPDFFPFNYKGILLKGGRVLDALAACQIIAFDKTGTLTTGKLMCKAIEPIHGHFVGLNKSHFSSCCVPSCEKEALAVAAAMEKGTTHPIGRSV